MQMNYKIQGIPCIINAVEDSWEVLDRNGNFAGWLEEKLSVQDCQQITRDFRNFGKKNVDY